MLGNSDKSVMEAAHLSPLHMGPIQEYHLIIEYVDHCTVVWKKGKHSDLDTVTNSIWIGFLIFRNSVMQVSVLEKDSFLSRRLYN